MVDILSALVQGFSDFWNGIVTPLWNLIVGGVQFIFGKGPYAQYSIAFPFMILIIIFGILGFKIRKGFLPFIEAMVDDIEKQINRSETYYRKKRRKK